MWPFLTSYYIQDGQGPTHVGSGNLRALPTAVMPPPILSASGLFAKYTQQAPKIRKKSPNRGPWQFRSALITSSSLEPASEPDKSKELIFVRQTYSNEYSKTNCTVMNQLPILKLGAESVFFC